MSKFCSAPKAFILFSVFFLTSFLPFAHARLLKLSFLPTDTVKSEIIDTASPQDLLILNQLGAFYFPIHGKVISCFGKRGHRIHTGTDIKLNHGDSVRAAYKGKVTKASSYYGYGILVVLSHGYGIETYYAHLSKALVHEGDSVEQGSVIGLGGRTGRATTDHLHFEIRFYGHAYNSEQFFDFTNQNTLTEVIQGKKIWTVPEKKINVTAIYHEKYHLIRKKDTLYSLSKKYGTSVKSLCGLNHIKPGSVLTVGKKLKVN
jgi:murein DD-endopeptidase MepM/ murein hydrolase activator NlpD